MQHSIEAESKQQEQYQASVLSGISLLIGLGMALAILAGMIGGKVHGWKGGVSMLILWSVPVCTIGTALALASLVWRSENKHLAQIALWVNGMVAFFAFPLLVYWLLGMN